MLQTLNQYLPACTLASLLFAIALLSNDLNKVQSTQSATTDLLTLQTNVLNETQRQQGVHSRLITNLEQNATEQSVRLVRIESAICSQLPRQRTVQCPNQ